MKKTALPIGLAAALWAGALSAADSELLVFDWSGYDDPGFYADYAKMHGDDPSFTFFGEEEEAFQKLRAGFRADISHPCSQSVQKWRDAELLEPWDTSKIPNYRHIADSFKESEVFAPGGDVYFIPADMGATAILYRTDMVDSSKVRSLDVFHNPEFAGRTSIGDNVDDAYALAYLATGTPDWTRATEGDFRRASEWLRKAHRLVRTYWVDGAELSSLVASGEVLVAWSWNETPTTMRADGHPVAFEREPVEGSSTWACGYVNLRNDQGSEEKAYDYINAWLTEETAQYIVNEWGYGHSNTMAMGRIDPGVLEDVGLGPVNVPVLEQLPMDNRLRERMSREFEKIKAGF